MTKMEFKPLEKVDSTKEVIKDVFGADLDISGGWGYDRESAVVVHSLAMAIDQFLNLFATVRANIEMNLTMEEDERFGGINVSFENMMEMTVDNRKYDVATFKISGMKEKIYNQFIKEYKEGYGKKEFDMADHFERRKQNTVERIVDFWFYGLREE